MTVADDVPDDEVLADEAAEAVVGPDTKLRFEGCLLGLACGDALGYAVEFSSLEAIRQRFGPDGIRDLQLAVNEDGRGIALFSDDTQMTISVADGLVRSVRKNGRRDPVSTARDVADELVAWRKNPPGGHRAPGNACTAGCRALERGVPWMQAGAIDAGGCGSVMRSAPYGLLHARDGSKAGAAAHAAFHSRMTHRHPWALAASAALAVAVRKAANGEASREMVAREAAHAASWFDKQTASMIVTATENGLQASALEPKHARLMRDEVLNVLRGWTAHECIAAAIFCFCSTSTFVDCVVAGANTPGDSDSIACVAGAIAGAFYGLAGVPMSWIDVIERQDELFAVARNLYEVAGAP